MVPLVYAARAATDPTLAHERVGEDGDGVRPMA
jgi:hypothetical protein